MLKTKNASYYHSLFTRDLISSSILSFIIAVACTIVVRNAGSTAFKITTWQFWIATLFHATLYIYSREKSSILHVRILFLINIVHSMVAVLLTTPRLPHVITMLLIMKTLSMTVYETPKMAKWLALIASMSNLTALMIRNAGFIPTMQVSEIGILEPSFYYAFPSIVLFLVAQEGFDITSHLRLALNESEQARQKLIEVNASIEQQVRDRTSELAQANAELEIANQRLQALMLTTADLAIEQERTRVSKEIHDGLGQHLYDVKAHATAAARSIDHDPISARDSLKSIKAATGGALQELRRAVKALSSKALTGSLEDLLAEPIRGCEIDGIAVTFQVTGTPRPLSDEVKHNLFRIVQEALNNVRKHAQAGQVLVYLDYQPERLCIVVQDNGVGLPPTPNSGHGLINLQTRAAGIGATLIFASHPGQGVCITTEVPL